MKKAAKTTTQKENVSKTKETMVESKSVKNNKPKLSTKQLVRKIPSSSMG